MSPSEQTMESGNKEPEALHPSISGFEGSRQLAGPGLALEPELFLIPYDTAESDQYQQQSTHEATAGSRKRSRGPHSENIFDGIGSGHGNTHENKPKRATRSEGVRGPTGLKFACPFLKHDRLKYMSRRGCAWSSFPDVHRVKEHLSRHHMPPKFRCQRCYEHFASEADLAEHLRAEQRCEKRDAEPEEWIGEDRLRALRSRKKMRKPMSQPEKWEEIYKILFPDADSVPSPYYNLFLCESDVQNVSAVFRQVEEFAGSEFPRLLRLEFGRGEGGTEHLTSEIAVDHSQAALKKLLRSFEQHVMRSSSASEEKLDPPQGWQSSLQLAAAGYVQQETTFDLDFAIFPTEEPQY